MKFFINVIFIEPLVEWEPEPSAIKLLFYGIRSQSPFGEQTSSPHLRVGLKPCLTPTATIIIISSSHISIVIIIIVVVISAISHISIISHIYIAVAIIIAVMAIISYISIIIIVSVCLPASLSVCLSLSLNPTGQGRWPPPRAQLCPRFRPLKRKFFLATVAKCLLMVGIVGSL